MWKTQLAAAMLLPLLYVSAGVAGVTPTPADAAVSSRTGQAQTMVDTTGAAVTPSSEDSSAAGRSCFDECPGDAEAGLPVTIVLIAAGLFGTALLGRRPSARR